jgi:hypothetical protein
MDEVALEQFISQLLDFSMQIIILPLPFEVGLNPRQAAHYHIPSI